MILTEEKIIPKQKRTVQVGIKCDSCHKEFNCTWNCGMYEVLETNISMKIGNQYPEGGSGEEFTFDICPECFKTKLIPFLVSLAGRTIEWKEWDW